MSVIIKSFNEKQLKRNKFLHSYVICEYLSNSNATNDLDRIVEVFRKITNPSEYFCIPWSYESMVELYKQSDVDFGIRQFLYQKCSTLGWLPTTNSPYQPFGSGISTDLFYNYCMDIFDNKLVRYTCSIIYKL